MSEATTQSVRAMLEMLASQIGADTVHELVTVYDDNSKLQLARAKEAFGKGDHKGVKAEAHGLKSSSANMGAQELSELCLKIEKSVGLDANTAAWLDLAHLLRDEAVTAMNAWRQSQNPK